MGTTHPRTALTAGRLLLLRLDLPAGAGDDARCDLGALLRLRAGCGREHAHRSFGLLGLVRDLIGHLDLGGRSADAEETGLRILQHLDGHAVAVHAELLQRRRNGKIDGLTGRDDKLFHDYSFSSCFV